MLIALLSLAVAGLGALWYALKTSVRGYEDEFGFHEGVELPVHSVRETVRVTATAPRENPTGKKKVVQKVGDGVIEQTTLSFY